MNDDSKALKSGFWYLIANFVIKAMALITTPIFTRLLTKEQFGDYSNWFSWTSIALIIITMSMESSLISAKFDFEGKLEQYDLSLIGITLVSASFWALIVNVFWPFFTDLLNLSTVYINYMLLYCFFHEVINIFQVNERYHFRYKRAVYVALMVAVSTTAVSIFLVLNMQDRLAGRVMGTVLPIVIIGAFLCCYFLKYGKRIDFSVWPYALRICIPFIPHLLSLTILNSVDRIMITKICGSSDTALYSVAYTCGHMVTILMTSMNSAFSPWLGEKLHEEKYEEIRKVTRYYISMFCILAILIMFLSPEVLVILGGRSYLEAKYVMTPVAMGCVCQFLYTLFVNVEQYKKNTIGMAIASVSAALLNYVLNLIFIPIYGYIAAAYTTLVSYLFLLIVHMLLVKRMGYEKTYSYIYIIRVTFVMMAVTIGVNFLYKYSPIRYAVFGGFCITLLIILYKKRTLAKRLVRMIIVRD